MHHHFSVFLLTLCSIYVSKQQETLPLMTSPLSTEDICQRYQQSCEACIQANPGCAWCSENTNQTMQGFRQIRCRTLSENENSCPPANIEHPLSSMTASRNEAFSEIVESANLANVTVIQLQPQAIDVKLRQGLPQKINFTFRRVVDYPLDLYYVMDLSYSMNDDLETLQRLGRNLVEGIRNITNNVRLGFGTFVDKVMLPFASTVPDQLANPCLNTENDFCAPVFGFRHQLPITSDNDSFIEAVRATEISGNIDTPEGGFDALMQIAVCEEIRWRAESLRVILFTSDASPHIAMDGKLAAILDINDMQCHLEKNVHKFYPNASVYALSKQLDYPSVGQLKKAFADQKIQPVFAVTADVFPIYDKLSRLLNPAYAYVLNSDSSNVVTLISESYNEIRSQVQLNQPSLPENVELRSYRVLCPGDDTWRENSLECNNVTIGKEAIFQLEIASLGCPDNVTNDVITINSNSIQDIATLNIEYLCDCECASRRKENNTQCSNQGDLECGVCACYDEIRGSQCQCTASTSDKPLEQNCTDIEYVDGATVCRGNGFCECGICQCNEGFYGKYCECQNRGCSSDSQGRTCGGMEQGTCVNCNNNPQCECINGWTLDIDGACTCHNDECRANQTSSEICSGNGICNCDSCVCSSIYEGQFCQECIHPDCVGFEGTCSGLEIRACAVCIYDADIRNLDIAAQCQDVCVGMGIQFSNDDSLPSCQRCLEGFQDDICETCNTFSQDLSVHLPVTCDTVPFDDRTCILQYMIVWDVNRRQYVVFVKNFEQSDCPQVDPLTIVLPVVGGILFVGIIALIIWKIIQTIRDKHEYQRFIQETQNAKWSAGNNQLYVDPNARITNPMFVGN